MNDLQKYVDTRMSEDVEFADGYDEGYANFKLGVLLRQLREATELTQEEIASLLGTQKSTISKIENYANDTDDLRPEYDLTKLRVRRVGEGRQSYNSYTVELAPDVADVFPDSDAVNEALRFLIRITNENRDALPKANINTD